MNEAPIRCQSCERVVAPTAWRCPSCHRLTRHGKSVLGVMIGVIVVVAFFAAGAIWG